MKIENGLFSLMTMQRDAKGVSCQPFNGSCKASGLLRATVSKNGKPLKGLKSVPVGKAEKGAFKGVLCGIPAGGPYDVELALSSPAGKPVESLKLKSVMVGDVWILAGQSNMEGVGDIKYALKSVNEVRAFYMEDRWGVAKDPLHVLFTAAAPIHRMLGAGPRNPLKGVGPGVAFGQEMFRRTGVPQGLIACGHGGTSMSQWDPALKVKGGESLYGAMLGRVARNGGMAAGVIWYQGCSDANANASALYTRRMAAFVKALRRDLRAPALPFATVQISRVTNPNDDAKSWMSIREQQRLLPRKVKGLATVPAIDLRLDDCIHISGDDQAVLGVRLAGAMLSLKKAPKSVPPIELDFVKVESGKERGGSILTVSFKNVSGGLHAPGGRPCGFALVAGMKVQGSIYRTDIAGSKVVIFSTLNIGEAKSMQLCYGFGVDPFCNVLDGAGRSLPAFGPVDLGGKPMPMTPYADRFLVSDPVFVEETMANLVHPSKRDGLAFKPCEPMSFFAVPKDRLSFTGPEPKIRYFKTSYECSKDLRVRLLFGYDGPMKLYCDGIEVFRDPKGINPIIPGHKSLLLDWKAGVHELVFALSINKGKAWGVCLRIGLNGQADLDSALREI